mgnify:CR=1 FL=1
MSSLFEDLKEGLEEAIAYEKGYGAGRVKTYICLLYTSPSPRD